MKIVIIGTLASSILGFRKPLIKELVRQGHQVFAFAVDYTHESIELVLSLGAEPVKYTLNRSGLNPLSDLWAMWYLRNKLKKIQSDVVLSYFAKPVIFGTLAAKLARVPKVVGMLEGLGYVFTDQPTGVSYKVKILRIVQVFLYKIALPKLDGLIFLNKDDPVDLLSRYKIKARLVTVLGGIGVDLSEYPYRPAKIDKPVRFLFIGRLLAEKGIFDFIEAAKIVKQQFPEAEFVLLGGLDPSNPGGLNEKELNNLIQSGLVIYPGHVSNIADWIISSNVFVLPSYREGLPRSTQEAMAIGRAVITTDVPGCRDTVIDGVNGFIIPPWQPQLLAEKMRYFIEQPERIRLMGDASHKMALEKYDVDKINAELIDVMGLSNGN